MKLAAVTGHTSGLGKLIAEYLQSQNFVVQGFSRSTGHDLRDYARVTHMLDQVRDHDLFVNCAKPDYAQSQILYRLVAQGFAGKILNIGTPVIHQSHAWTDLGLLEYVTQKTALWHAHNTLTKIHPNHIVMWEPLHAADAAYVAQYLDEVVL